MRCIVNCCNNEERDGGGSDLQIAKGFLSGWVCTPCLNFLTTGQGRESQLARNGVLALRHNNRILPPIYDTIFSMGAYGIAYSDGVYYLVDRGFSGFPVLATFGSKQDLIDRVCVERFPFWIQALNKIDAH